MKAFTKRDFPVSQIRRFLEPGPIVLVSSAWKGETNIMTMGWHTVMEFQPSLVGCMISSGNHSFGLIKASKQCVINIPTYDLAKQVVGIGNCSGADVDKFEKFKLTRVKGDQIDAPLIKECYANFECKVVECAGGRLAEGAAHHPLSRRRAIHGVGPRGELPQDVPAGELVRRAHVIPAKRVSALSGNPTQKLSGIGFPLGAALGGNDNLGTSVFAFC
jgi:Flavin reductase like domain